DRVRHPALLPPREAAPAHLVGHAPPRGADRGRRARPLGDPVPHSGTALAGLRVLECSRLGPGAIGTHLADLGAEVIKVESPAGDYIREMTWPTVNGVSLLHLHVSRGKQSVTLDLKKPEGVEIYRELVRRADVVVEAMR